MKNIFYNYIFNSYTCNTIIYNYNNDNYDNDNYDNYVRICYSFHLRPFRSIEMKEFKAEI